MDHHQDRWSARELGTGLVVAVGLLGACGDPAGPVSSDQYELASFDGAALPVELPVGTVFPADPPSGVVILSGSFVVSSDGTCRRTVVADLPENALGPERSAHESWWDCAWTEEAGVMSLTWVATSDEPIPLLALTVTVSSGPEGRLTLAFETGIICVRAPRPTGWSEVYERVGEPSL